jgi:hypothetical protein
MKKFKKATVDGNQAAAHVAYAFHESGKHLLLQ